MAKLLGTEMIAAQQVKTLTEHGKKRLEIVDAPIRNRGIPVFFDQGTALAGSFFRHVESRL